MWRRILLLGVLLAASLTAVAGEVRVAVASNFLAPLRPLAEMFERTTGHTLRISSGSTGKLYAQIMQGAPFDCFLSANSREPLRLESAGRVVPGSRFTYAVGRLALWSKRDGDFSPMTAEDVVSGKFTRIALANPRLAPYGEAAAAVLARLKSKTVQLVQGESIGQAYQYVASRAVDAGFVALSQLQREHRDSYWIVPTDWHPPLDQQALLLSGSEGNEAARQFLDFLRSATVRQQLVGLGYLPGEV